MTDTIITVQGEFSAWYPAERATVSVAVQLDGPSRDAVFGGAVASADTLRGLIEADFDPSSGPITRWNSDTVRVWSERPWNAEGAQLPLVFHAAVDFSARFSDFEALARWIESVVSIDGVTVASISWELTDATRTGATVEVRSRAVKDAVAKASVYAQSIGLGSVTAVALADPGMLGDPVGGSAPSMARASMLKSFDSGPQLALKPEQIEVAAAVDARFVAR